jgi:hypothetical protein
MLWKQRKGMWYVVESAIEKTFLACPLPTSKIQDLV